MKANKLKFLSLAACCVVTALWAETRGMEINEDRERNALPPSILCNSSFLTGSIVAFSGDEKSITPGCGWLLCDGQQYSNQRYPELYEVIKEKYVLSGSWVIEANKRSEIEKYFCVPDLRGRVIVGVDGATGRVTSNNTLGVSGGEERHQLTVAELASHSHPLPASGGPGVGIQPRGAGAIDFSIPMGTAGGDQPHNNMQPYLVLNHIINTGKMNRQPELNVQNEKINQLEKKIEELKISQQKNCPKWVVFNGSDGSVFCHSGVSSVTRKGNGWYMVNFLEPFSSKNYCFSLNSGNGDTSIGLNTTSAHHPDLQSEHNFTFHTFLTSTTSTTNPLVVSAIFYGNQ